MRGDNFIVGKRPASQPASKSAAAIVEDLAERAVLSAPPGDKRSPVKVQDVCGAMSQQRCDTGGHSTPQKFVRLVGCRDSGIKPQPKR
jgi:hypothetical protein